MSSRVLRGFTLAEMMVVLLVIVVLAAITIPAMFSLYSSSHRQSCLSNLQMLARSVTLYQQDHGRFPAMPGAVGVHGVQDGGVTGLNDADVANKFFWCPDDQQDMLTSLANVSNDWLQPKIATDTIAGGTHPYLEINGTVGYQLGEEAILEERGLANNRWEKNEWFFYDTIGTENAARDTGEETFTLLTVEKTRRDSTYNLGYNYYGNVTDDSGALFPVTTEDAARYLFTDPRRVTGIGDYQLLVTSLTAVGGLDLPSDYPGWDLGLIHTATEQPHSLYPGLWNINAPLETVISHCPHHPAEAPRHIPCAQLSGEAKIMTIEPTLPQFAADWYNDPTCIGPLWNGGNPKTPASFTAKRKSLNTQTHAALVTELWEKVHGSTAYDPVLFKQDYSEEDIWNKYSLQAPTDWRVNQAPYVARGDEIRESAVATADTPEHPVTMPIVQRFECPFSSSDLHAGDHWYNTGVLVGPGSLVMVAADARWNRNALRGRAFWENINKKYLPLFDDSGRLLFTAEGDPYAGPGTPVCPTTNYDVLIGKVVGRNSVGTVVYTDIVKLGSRGSIIVPATNPATNTLFLPGTTFQIYLTANNDTVASAPNAYDNHYGWCLARIGVFYPQGRQ